MYQYFDNTGFDCHPDKTTVGRVEKGFDWLGVWFDEKGPVGVAYRKGISDVGCRGKSCTIGAGRASTVN